MVQLQAPIHAFMVSHGQHERQNENRVGIPATFPKEISFIISYNILIVYAKHRPMYSPEIETILIDHVPIPFHAPGDISSIMQSKSSQAKMEAPQNSIASPAKSSLSLFPPLSSFNNALTNDLK